MFLKNFFKTNKDIFLAVTIVFIFLESLVAIGVHYTKENNINNFLLSASPDFNAYVKMANISLKSQSEIFFDLEVNKPEVVEIMLEASTCKDTKKLAQLRDRLYKFLFPTYIYMRKNGIKQLHFHLPDSISFLRFHRPNKYGDSLVKARETINYVNHNKVRISAFEEGKVFSGFRNIYPIFKDKKFIGTVEISYSSSAIKSELIKATLSSYLFVIKNSVIKNKVFKEEQINYKKSEFNGFTYDRDILEDTMELRLSKLFKINRSISKKVNKRIQNGEQFSVYNKQEDIYDNTSIVISFIPISNLDNKVVAYIINYEFSNFIDMLLKNVQILFLVLTILVIVLTTAFAMVLLNEKKKQKNIYEFATHDALTKIFNRHGFNELFGQKMDESKRHKKALSLIFFDIDFFKNVNDDYGHDIGDYVLQNIARIVSQEIRSSDIFARWGGEEFIIFLPETDMKSATDVAQKLRKLIEFHAFSSINKVTCSFGVTQLRNDDDKTSLLKRVDEYLYRAKESGRNCVVDDNS